MNIVGISACAAGIAHTYIAKQKLIDAAEKAGHTIHIETQGTVGTEDKLEPEEIASADIAVIAADIQVSGKDRFKQMRMVEIPTELAIKSPNKFIAQLEKIANS